MTLLLEILRTYVPLSLPRQSLQDVLVSVMGNRGAVLQVKVAVAPESVPRLGARAALQIPPISVEVHHWHAPESEFDVSQASALGGVNSDPMMGHSEVILVVLRGERVKLLRCLLSKLLGAPSHNSQADRCIPGNAYQ